MLFLIAIFMIIFSILNIYSPKKTKLVSLMLLLLILVLFIGNNDNPDYLAYLRNYEKIENNSFKEFVFSSGYFGFDFLQYISYNIGFNYNMFVLLVSLIGYGLIVNTIRFFSINENYVLLLYFIYPFFFDLIQLKNFLAMSILIYSIKYLLSNKKSDTFRYIMLIFVASLIHPVSIVYLCLLITKFSYKNMIFVFLTILSFLVSIGIRFNFINLAFLESVFFADDFLVTKFTYFETRVRYGFLVFSFFNLYSLLLIILSIKILEKNNKKNYSHEDYKNSKEYKFAYLMGEVNLFLTIICLPFYFINSNFFRIYRNIFLLNYIAFAITRQNYCEEYPNNNLIAISYDLLVYLLILILFFYSFVYSDNGIERILKPIFNNNLFLDVFKI